MCRPGILYPGEGTAAFRLLPSACGVRGAERGAGADVRPGLEEALPDPRWGRRYAVTGRARLRDAPEPLHRAGENRAPAGLYCRRDERIADRALAGWPAAGQDTRNALRRSRAGDLNSPTVSHLCSLPTLFRPTHAGNPGRQPDFRHAAAGGAG